MIVDSVSEIRGGSTVPEDTSIFGILDRGMSSLM